MKRIPLLLLFGVLILVIYMSFNNSKISKTELMPAVETNQVSIENNKINLSEEKVIKQWFAPLVPFIFGEIKMLASVADSEDSRAKGLSDTPYLPNQIAKVFIFDRPDTWSFWMKDMNYPIDIFWLDEDGKVVHIIENVTPDTYPDTSFVPPAPAKYVIETKAGFAKENNIRVGDGAGMTQILKDR